MREWPRKSVSLVKQELRIFQAIYSSGYPDVRDEEDLSNLRITTSGAIALSVIILQAFISIGVSNPFALASVLCFAIGLPMQVAFWFLSSGILVFKPAFLPGSLKFLLYGGGFASLAGILAAFAYVSQIAAYVLLISAIISTLIFIHRYYYAPEERAGIDD